MRHEHESQSSQRLSYLQPPFITVLVALLVIAAFLVVYAIRVEQRFSRNTAVTTEIKAQLGFAQKVLFFGDFLCKMAFWTKKSFSQSLFYLKLKNRLLCRIPTFFMQSPANVQGVLQNVKGALLSLKNTSSTLVLVRRYLQLIGDVPGIGNRPRQAIELRHHHGFALTNRGMA